ncbi:hypothetical protein [Glacieibacterium frigidum]|uniref:Uncharacterized protein n=1 Tax=Glacieibacterium frigidum TaxID=2593303 RepID=A0A552UJ36_9SPHN|nr:hypothetical protein [Glacieibacterium frigidum]TRW18243.1 hypothetical protein FMM06_09140 [Glacieibacterium frigidum]
MIFETDSIYFTRREREELVLAHATEHRIVRRAHHAMANAYQDQLEALAVVERAAWPLVAARIKARADLLQERRLQRKIAPAV